MKLFIISSILIVKSLSIPFNINQDNTNCYESTNYIYQQNATISAFNKALSNSEDRTPIHINTNNNTCGISVMFNQNLSRIILYHGAIPTIDCNSSNIMCSTVSKCSKAINCCNNDHSLLGFSCNNKYQLKILNPNSTAYQQNRRSCQTPPGTNLTCYLVDRLFNNNISTAMTNYYPSSNTTEEHNSYTYLSTTEKNSASQQNLHVYSCLLPIFLTIYSCIYHLPQHTEFRAK